MRIQKLSPSVINKIAAGEVIERPASVVKELLENALDAGAMRIDIELEKGGADLIRVVDDGHGIAADDLPLAIAPHATSKIESADDLFHVGSLGFRGEALASIAEISRLTIRSRARDAADGYELSVEGGMAGQPSPCGCSSGTALEVRDLFYTTPVRRKFMRSVQTELGHASEAFTRLALAHPEVHFTLKHNGRQVYDLPPSDPWVSRIAQFFGQELAEELIWVENLDQQVRLYGYVANPRQSRGNQRMQYLFLNGRAIRDRSLQHALGEAYRGLMLTGRYPISFLHLGMPPELVDVNVHPTKLEVRFQDGSRLYSQVLGTLRTKFLASDLTARAAIPDTTTVGRADVSPSPTGATDGGAAARQEIMAWAESHTRGRNQGHAGPHASGMGDVADRDVPPWRRDEAQEYGHGYGHAPLALHRVSRPSGEPALTAPAAAELDARAQQTLGRDYPRMAPGAGPHDCPSTSAESLSQAAADAISNLAPATSGPALQIHNRYIVAESPEGMLVIDQHALHERVLYEQLRARVLAGPLESQALLVPEPVDLAPAEAALALEQLATLHRLGVNIEPFGGDTVLVTSYPAMLRHVNPGELLRGLLEPLVSAGTAPQRRDALDELLHMMSCKAAVKAGDPLTDDEIATLLAQRHLVADTHHCPHGRPTALVFTRDELDRQFKRT